MHESRLGVFDAQCHAVNNSGWSTDWAMFWAFAEGDDAIGVDLDGVESALRSRLGLLDVLRRRIVDLPGHIDFPYWSRASEPVDIEFVDARTRTWPDCLESLAGWLHDPMDAAVRAFRIVVFTGVGQVPGATGTATVVALLVNHALVVGPDMTALGDALFGAAPEPVVVPGLPPAAGSVRASEGVVRGLLRTPLLVARGVRAAIGGIDTSIHNPPADIVPTAFGRRAEGHRAIHCFTVDGAVAKEYGVTVTSYALTAISYAMQRYLGEIDDPEPPALYAIVTTAVTRGAEFMGVNRIVYPSVSLHTGTEAPRDRAAAIGRSVAAESARAAGADALTTERTNLNLTYAAVRVRARRHVESDTANAATVLTSIRCRPSGAWTLSGRPLLVAAMVPPLNPALGLTHSIVGAEGRFAVAVYTSESAVTQPARYAAILSDSFHTLSR